MRIGLITGYPVVQSIITTSSYAGCGLSFDLGVLRDDVDIEVASELRAWLQFGYYTTVDTSLTPATSARIICRKWKINCISDADHGC